MGTIDCVNFVMRMIATFGVERASTMLNEVINDHNRAIRDAYTDIWYHINTSNYSDNQCIFSQWLSASDGFVKLLDLDPDVPHPYKA